MDRREFIRDVGIFSLSSLIPFKFSRPLKEPSTYKEKIIILSKILQASEAQIFKYKFVLIDTKNKKWYGPGIKEYVETEDTITIFSQPILVNRQMKTKELLVINNFNELIKRIPYYMSAEDGDQFHLKYNFNFRLY